MIQRVVALLSILRTGRRTRARLLIVSAHDPLLCLAAVTAAFILGIPIVIDAHDTRLVLGVLNSRQVSRRIKMYLERTAMRRANRVWVPTRSLANSLGREYGVGPNSLRVVENGAAIARFHSVERETGGSKELLHLGGPRDYYDTESLVLAFRSVRQKIPEATLTFLGIREDKYTELIRRQCRSFGLESAVRLLLPVSREEVGAFMNRAAAGLHTYRLHPAYANTVGLKVIEYMAAGIPVIHRGPQGGETWRIVEESGAGLCAETVNELAGAMISVLKDPALRRRLGDKGLNAAVRYDWSATMGPAVDDTEDLLGARSR